LGSHALTEIRLVGAAADQLTLEGLVGAEALDELVDALAHTALHGFLVHGHVRRLGRRDY